MKKTAMLCYMVLLLMILGISVQAGSVPEDLLYYDGAKVFFGEVVKSYDDGSMAVSPVKKIKGDVRIGSKQNYDNVCVVGDFKVKDANVYLFAYYDDVNPVYMFSVTGYDTKTLRLKHAEGSMWDRIEKYLNDGEFEKAEKERIDKVNSEAEKTGEKITLSQLYGHGKEKVYFFFYNDSQRVHEIDGKRFYEVADKIVLTGTNNANSFSLDGFYISEEKDSLYGIYVSEECVIDSCYSPLMSRLPFGEYVIKADDREKLLTLIESDEKKLQPMENAIGNVLYFAMDNIWAVTVGGCALLFVLAFLTGFVIVRKRRKQ